MSHYSHLLSPLRVGNVFLKNRMVAANALPHFLQGPESFPAEPVIDHIAGLARNGAAMVTFADWFDQRQRTFFNPDGKRFPMYDPKDPSVENYLSQMADAVHFYGSKIALAIMHFGPAGYEIVDTPAMDTDFSIDMTDIGGMANRLSQLWKGDFGAAKQITEEKMAEMADEIAERCKWYQNLGWDAASLHMSYRMTMPGKFLSAITNTRTDEYGGSMQNRARFPLAICRRIKEVCGQDFLVEVQISGEEEGGTTLAETIEFAQLCDGVVDILQVRAGDADLGHPTGWNSAAGEPLTLQYAKAIKASGARVLVEPIGGFQDPVANDEYIASGKADMIGMARAFICDFDYYEKIVEGRADEIVPCIRCNKCHVPSLTGPWVSVCSVNPRMGVAHRMGRLAPDPTATLKVAVVGGGPAGMEAAILARGRGHDVTLFEKTDYLGGQLRIADASGAKWPLKAFKDYLVRQLYKSGATVLLETPVTPETIKEGGFDAVFVSVGAKPKIPAIPGADGDFVHTPVSVYGDHESLGKRVIVVGGSETGTETGMYLAEHGHDVTVLTRNSRLAYDATPVHYVEMVRHVWERMENFHYLTDVVTTSVAKGTVTYKGPDGVEKTLEADDMVLSGGMEPRYDEAVAFFGSADRFFLIGDCSGVGSVQTCMRTALGAVSQL
jgi:2,4-dienoyl-CoA reductase-like NADH-dependent reductase (Old Yellow Enzyme family)/thioredoxin reductase